LGIRIFEKGVEDKQTNQHYRLYAEKWVCQSLAMNVARLKLQTMFKNLTKRLFWWKRKAWNHKTTKKECPTTELLTPLISAKWQQQRQCKNAPQFPQQVPSTALR